VSLIELQVMKLFISQCQSHDYTVPLHKPAITEWRKILSHAVKQSLALDRCIHCRFTNSQGWPKIKKKK